MSTSKIALVTGGSRGLGKDMALQLAQQGIDVILTYHSQQAEAASVVAAIEALGQRAVALRLNAADLSTFEAFFFCAGHNGSGRYVWHRPLRLSNQQLRYQPERAHHRNDGGAI